LYEYFAVLVNVEFDLLTFVISVRNYYVYHKIKVPQRMQVMEAQAFDEAISL
jgi:hypothetical protein